MSNSEILAEGVANQDVSVEDFRNLVASLGFTMKDQDEQDYLKVLRGYVQACEFVSQLPEYQDPRLVPSVQPDQRGYTVPEKATNPLNGWSHRVEIKDTNQRTGGLLAGRSVAIKDTISIAGVPFTCGTQPYHLSKDVPYPIPTIDAPVVTRVLESGGVIKGTSTCENYCMSGVSFSSAIGPVENPWVKGYSTGGSSSGSAALVAIQLVKKWREKRGLHIEDLGEGVDIALGGDQGGSVRLPAAMSGIYGLKPTHGLVPYTGIAALHPLLDTCGPMAASIRDVAIVLSAIAGYDGIDPRMTPETPLRNHVPLYHELLDAAIAERQSRDEWTPTTAAKGLRIGILKEAFARPELDPAMSAMVKHAAARFSALGGTVTEISIPLHEHAMTIWSAVNHSTLSDVFLLNKAPDLISHTLPNLIPPPMNQKWYETMTAFNPAVVATLFGGEYLSNKTRFAPSMRGKAVMHVHELRAAYDNALKEVDVLVLPVTPCVGPPHPGPEAGVAEKYGLALGMSGNTAPFNLTGHPGLSIPAGWGEAKDGEGKLPVGMQIVGRRWDEVGVLFAAAAWEVGGLGLDE